MLHTPTAQEPGITTERLVTKDGQPAKIGERAYDKETGRLAQVGLSQQVMMMQPFLKTPCTADSYTDKMKSKGVSGTSGTLAQEVVNGYAAEHRGLILPTPQTQGLKVCDEEGKTQFMDLNLLPTPVMHDYKGRTNPGQKKEGCGNTYGELLPDMVYRMEQEGTLIPPNPTTPENAGKTSRLSPLFTEEMMGFPLMWTALPFLSESGAPKPSKPTATPSSPK